jgi:hypothetical protein
MQIVNEINSRIGKLRAMAQQQFTASLANPQKHQEKVAARRSILLDKKTQEVVARHSVISRPANLSAPPPPPSDDGMFLLSLLTCLLLIANV